MKIAPMRHLSFFFAATLPLIGAPAHAGSLLLMCNDDAPRFSIDSNTRTIIQHSRDGSSDQLKIESWGDDVLRTRSSDEELYGPTWWTLDLAAMTATLEFRRPNGRGLSRWKYPCAEVAAFPPAVVPPPPTPEELALEARVRAEGDARRAAERARWGMTADEWITVFWIALLPLAFALLALGFAVRSDLKARRRARRQ